MWNIIFYRDHRGKSPPLEFIEELPVMDQVKVRNTLRLLREFGTDLGMPHARPIRGKLWELRPGGIRLFYFAIINKKFVILHGYRKKSMKAPQNEIGIAIRRMEEYLIDANP
jgi:phage-related protein